MKNIAILLVLAVAAIAAPAFTFFAASSYAQYKEASIRNADLERQQRELHEYGEEVAEYKRFAGRVERFIANARAAGISDEGWNRHHVDIQNRVASFGELAQFIEDSTGGDNYYFLPAKLQIQTGTAGGAASSFGRRAAATSADQVRVSLMGEFLVPVQ